MYLIVNVGKVSDDEGQEERGDQMHPLMLVLLLVAIHGHVRHLFHQFRSHRRLCARSNKQNILYYTHSLTE